MPMWILMYVFSYSVSPAATSDRAECGQAELAGIARNVARVLAER
jgi:hypothetical protein